jgi:hypothetical protein
MVMRYTSTPPTEAGWYWIKTSHKGRERLVEFVMYHGVLTDFDRERRYGMVSVYYYQSIGAKFAGPITRPEE